MARAPVWPTTRDTSIPSARPGTKCALHHQCGTSTTRAIAMQVARCNPISRRTRPPPLRSVCATSTYDCGTLCANTEYRTQRNDRRGLVRLLHRHARLPGHARAHVAPPGRDALAPAPLERPRPVDQRSDSDQSPGREREVDFGGRFSRGRPPRSCRTDRGPSKLS